MKPFHILRFILQSLASAFLFLPTHAAEVSFPLPDPDGKAGDVTKSVKVYILAGQSNMVGMGNLSGARNVYDGVYLSSNPDVPDGPLQIYKVGNYKTAPLAVYLPDGSAHELVNNLHVNRFMPGGRLKPDLLPDVLVATRDVSLVSIHFI